MPRYCWGRVLYRLLYKYIKYIWALLIVPPRQEATGLRYDFCQLRTIFSSFCTDVVRSSYSVVHVTHFLKCTRSSMQTITDQTMLAGTPCLGTLTLRHISRAHIVARGQDALTRQPVLYPSALYQQLELTRHSRQRWNCCRASQQPRSDASDVPLDSVQEAAASTSAIAQKDM